MKWVDRFKTLPKSTKNLLVVGVLLALVAALPLFIWAITTQKFLITQKAASGEPTPFAVNVFEDHFDGSGMLDTSKWGWFSEGQGPDSVIRESGRLKLSFPAGSVDVGDYDRGKLAIVSPQINSHITTITGDFTLTVDLAEITTTSGWQGVRFGPSSAIEVRRTKVGSNETLDVYTSPNNASAWTKNTSIPLPANSGSVTVKMTRTGSEIVISYNTGSGFISLLDISMAGFENDTGLPVLDIQNEAPDYAAVTGYFDNYVFSGFILPSATSSPQATATPTPYPSGSPVACTLEAKTCPDGSTVGRIPPNCDFAPCPSVPTPTATPTSPPIGYRNFGILLKFDGVTDGSAEGAGVRVGFQSRTAFPQSGYGIGTSPIAARYIGNGIYKIEFRIPASSLPPANDYSIILKGEKHVGVKFCYPNGQSTRCAPGFWGTISIPNSENLISLNFAGIPLPAGDTYTQDGRINQVDFDRINALLSKPYSEQTSDDLRVGDLDYNGRVDIRDMFLLRKSLQVRYDEN